MFDSIKSLLGIGNEAEIKRVGKIVERIEGFAGPYQKLGDAQLRAKTDEFKTRLAGGETLDDLLPEAFAAVGEAASRVIGQTPFRPQYVGGVVLHQGRISEMKTGEGKTLTAVLPAYLNALAGKGVHIVTVNDYLAKFQGEWMGRIFRFLGMHVGLILHDMDNEARRAAYAADVTYGTNNEFGFDYLRDNMVVYEQNMVQRDLHFAIVDEVDSILIDEARTPLIISGMGEASTQMYERADQFVRTLTGGVAPQDKGRAYEPDEEEPPRVDYEVEEKHRAVTLTPRGVAKAEQYFGVENLMDIENSALNHHINQALKANAIFRLDVDYVVKDGQVIIVDEFTGRLMVGRRYSEGLHQAIEAKEHVKVERESKTLATITFQNYFRMYKKLSGMTGTAKTEEEEFQGIYKLDVVVIPTHRPMIRKDENDLIYRNANAKFEAVVRDIKGLHAQGRPVLVGTVSVEISEMLSSMLQRAGVPHTVLNAKYHEREAEIVAQAGTKGAVTIATNMAGRGTDILLGGNPDLLARQRMAKEGFSPEQIDEAQGYSEDAPPEVREARALYAGYLAEHKRDTDRAHDEVVALGGLHIIGTERHESRRIDNQLRGRSGRQGDPGSSRFYISLEDDLIRRFGGDRIAPLIDRIGLKDDEPLEMGLLTKQIENAQKRVEGHNFAIRKNVLQYDDVMNTQREVIYGQRRQVLAGADMHGEIRRMIGNVIERAVNIHCSANIAEEWDAEGLTTELSVILPLNGFDGTGRRLADLDDHELLKLTRESLQKTLLDVAATALAERAKEAQENNVNFAEVERVILLRAVDARWMDQIDDMDQLRHGIGLRAIAQRDPVVEYKFEGFSMFEAMIRSIEEDVARMIYHTTFTRPIERKQEAQPLRATHGDEEEAAAARRPAKAAEKVGRNAPCPCGSGKKYKNCCGRSVG